MAIQLSYRQEPGLLLVQVSGPWTTPYMRDAIGAVRAEADKRKLAHLLIDTRGLSLPETELERFFAGVRWAEHFPADFRAAFLVTNELYTGFAEMVALNRGANIRAHFDEAAARRWLQDGL